MKAVVTVPTINANDEFVVVVRWHVPDGGRVVAGAPLVDVETTKAVVGITSDHEGWVRHLAREAEEIGIGAELAWILSDEQELAASAAPGPEKTPPKPHPGRPQPVEPAAGLDSGGSGKPEESRPALEPTATRLTPAAEKLAASKGIITAELAGKRLGLVTSGALRSLLESKADSPLNSEKTPLAKRAEIQALHQGASGSLRSSLTLYFDSAGVRAAAEERDAGLLPIILAELGRLIAVRPAFTAYHEEGRTVFYDRVDLGVAIDLGKGLRVVTVPGANGLDADAIERVLAERTLDYMENRLAPADVEGSTLTVTDLSGFDILQFEPLINGRQSAILGIGGDSTLPGHPMSLTMAFDHRVLTGREAAELLRDLRDAILAQAADIATHDRTGAPETACCDRCKIDLASYYAAFAQVGGIMHQYTRPDGSTGLICHACLASP